MTWTRKILRQFLLFSHKNSSSFEPGFHGPYNTLLCTLFPADTDFSVFPRYKPGSQEVPVRYFLDVLYKEKLVFMLEHRADPIEIPSYRDDADLDLRLRIEDLRPECPLPVLHAVSAFGTRLSFYKMHHDQPIQPSLIRDHTPWRGFYMKGRAPRKWWNCDILKEEGAKRFKSTVEEIKQACAAL